MSDWENFSLGDVCNFSTDKIEVSKLDLGNYISTENLLPNKGGITEAASLPKVVTTTAFDVGDILISNIRLYFKKIWRATFSGGCSNDVLVIRAKKNIEPKFLYYVLSEDKFFDLVTATAKGTKMPRGDKQVIKNYPVPNFPLETQKKIAAVLSALDDKIELNNAINKNLEEQAQTIYKKMFPAITTAEVSVGEYITPKRGKNLLVKDAINGNVPVVAGGLEPATYHNESNTAAPVLTIGASGNAGYVKLWNVPVWSSDSSFIDSSMTEDVYFWYVMLKLRQEEIYSLRTGTAQQHIYPKHIAQLPIKKLDDHSVKEFTKRVTPLFSMIGATAQENKKLGEIRDALLPRLMSGEIDVSKVKI